MITNLLQLSLQKKLLLSFFFELLIKSFFIPYLSVLKWLNS